MLTKYENEKKNTMTEKKITFRNKSKRFDEAKWKREKMGEERMGQRLKEQAFE